MNIIPAAVANKFGRPLLHLQKSSPKIMFIGGAAAGLAGTVLACRATLKLSDVLENADMDRLKAEALHGNPELLPENAHYDEKAYAKDLTVIKVRTLLQITKLYAPSAGLLMISAALLTGSHVTLNKRNASIGAAYAATDQAFNQYRDRVKDQLGEDVDRDMRYGTRVDKETVETADGKKKVVSHTRVAEGEPSLYAKFFDELCPDFKKNPEYNMIFLRAQQNFANEMLRARGHVFLNEIYDSLGIERTGQGAVVGWVWGKGGDDYIDFGIFDDRENERVRDFVNGRENAILLDFNVDGEIYRLI
jgi:uncharacterized protein DUF6353